MIKKDDLVIVRGQFNGKVFGINPGKKTVTVDYNGGYEDFPWGSPDVDPVNPDTDWDNARKNLLANVKTSQPQNRFSMNYWIVVESQSRKVFTPNGTIWSPSTANITSGNKASYENIKALKMGDVIFHVVKHHIAGVSIVTSGIQPAPCPYPKGSAFYGMSGYQVSVKWLFIPPIDLSTNQMKNFIKNNYIPGVPNSPSAFQSDGTIWQGAYLNRLELEIAKHFISNIKDPALVNLLPPVK